MKKFLAILLAVIMTLSLVACAKDGGAPKKDAQYKGKADKGVTDGMPEEVKTAVVQMRSNTPASVVGADGTLYSGKREFVWDVADYLVSNYKNLGEWKNDKFIDVVGSVVVYKEKGEATVFAVIDVSAPSVTYYSESAEGIYYSALMPTVYEEYTSNDASAEGISVSGKATGFTYDKENDVQRVWTMDENGYKYVTGTMDYLVTDTRKGETDVLYGDRVFYAYLGSGGYEVRGRCEYMTGVKKLALYDESFSTNGQKVETTYVSVVGSEAELSWPDNGEPSTYGTCSFVAVTAGRGWLWDSADYKVDTLELICIGEGEVPDAVKDFEGLIGSAGISYKKADLQGNYAPVISVLGVNFDVTADGNAAQEQIANAVKAVLAE